MIKTTNIFKEIDPADFLAKPFSILDKEWMLITAGNGESHKTFNTMTAAWGGLGSLWYKPVVFCFVRPTRYTYQFIEANDYFTLSFFTETYREALNILGKDSGRDGDKVSKAGLTAMSPEGYPNTVAFQEARLIMICKKLYFHDINPTHFLEPTIDKSYPLKDYHRMYIGKITALLEKTSQE